MANEKHLLLTARGTYVQTINEPEIWQNGIRLVCVFGSVSPDGDLPNTWDVFEDIQSSTDGGVDYVGNFGVQGPPTFTFDPVSYLHDYAVPSWHDFINGGSFGTKILLTDLHLYPIGDDGKAIESRSATATWETPVPGGGDTDLLPLEVARVVSWQTPQIGRKGRGRIYAAGSSKVDCDADGSWDGTRAGDMADDAQALLEGLSFSGTGAFEPHVRPIVTGKPWTKYGMITSLSVGSVFDAQRRRRNRLTESRQFRAPSYG